MLLSWMSLRGHCPLQTTSLEGIEHCEEDDIANHTREHPVVDAHHTLGEKVVTEDVAKVLGCTKSLGKYIVKGHIHKGSDDTSDAASVEVIDKGSIQ